RFLDSMLILRSATRSLIISAPSFRFIFLNPRFHRGQCRSSDSTGGYRINIKKRRTSRCTFLARCLSSVSSAFHKGLEEQEIIRIEKGYISNTQGQREKGKRKEKRWARLAK